MAVDTPEAVALPGGKWIEHFLEGRGQMGQSPIPFTSYPAEELLGHSLIYISFAFYFHVMHRMENPPRQLGPKVTVPNALLPWLQHWWQTGSPAHYLGLLP